jgi:hypothetical protein
MIPPPPQLLSHVPLQIVLIHPLIVLRFPSRPLPLPLRGDAQSSLCTTCMPIMFSPTPLSMQAPMPRLLGFKNGESSSSILPYLSLWRYGVRAAGESQAGPQHLSTILPLTRPRFLCNIILSKRHPNHLPLSLNYRPNEIISLASCSRNLARTPLLLPRRMRLFSTRTLRRQRGESQMPRNPLQ